MGYEFSEKYWDDYKKFLRCVEEIVKLKYSEKRLINLYKSPNSIIEDYKETVESGRDYTFTIFEWDDEISVRELIQNILDNEDVKQLDFFYRNFKNQVEEIDAELKSIMINGFERPNRKKWWEKGILRGGDFQYKENVMQLYSINLDEYRDR